MFSNSVYDHRVLETTQMSFNRWMEKETSMCWYSRTFLSNNKGTNCYPLQQLGWMSQALCWIKETCLRRFHAASFQIEDSLQKTNLSCRTPQWLPGFGGERAHREALESVMGWWSCSELCLWCWLHKSICVLKHMELSTRRKKHSTFLYVSSFKKLDWLGCFSGRYLCKQAAL